MSKNKKAGAVKDAATAFFLALAMLLSADSNATTDALRIKIAGGAYSDETVIRFIDGATAGFDGSYDAWKLFSFNAAVPNLFTKISSGDELAINSVPSFTASVTMDLFLKIGTAATYSITAEEPGPFSSAVRIVMKDLVTNQLYDLRNGITYAINLPVIAQTAAARFQAFFSFPVSIQVSNATCSACANGSVLVTKKGETNWQYFIADTSGNTLFSGTAPGSAHTITGLAPGNYSLTITGEFSCSENRSFSVNISPILLGASFVEFRATPSEEAVELAWSTGMESNTHYFTPEFSEDGSHYTETDHIQAAGNSSLLNAYFSSHKNNSMGLFYYRIKLTDINGAVSYSEALAVTREHTHAASAYPVPASEKLYIEMQGLVVLEIMVQMKDMSGRIVWNKHFVHGAAGSRLEIIIPEGIAPGIYTLTAKMAGSSTEQKIIIN